MDEADQFVEEKVAEVYAAHAAGGCWQTALRKVFRALAPVTAPEAKRKGAAANPAFGNPKQIPPLPEWVTAYSAHVGYPMDGEKWCASYEAKGWAIGKARMKNWQAAVITWRTNRYGFGSIAKTGDNGGRDYSRV